MLKTLHKYIPCDTTTVVSLNIIPRSYKTEVTSLLMISVSPSHVSRQILPEKAAWRGCWSTLPHAQQLLKDGKSPN